MNKFWRILSTSAFILLLAGCNTAANTDVPTPASLFPGEELTPYTTQTSTPTATATPLNIPTSTLIPTLTPTPVTYIAKAGDTLFSIAAKYGLTLDEIKAANPAINPYLLGPGMAVILPAPSGKTATPSAPQTTPYPLTVSETQCTPSQSGGLYCFAEATNDQSLMMDAITAEFLLSNAQGETLSQKALVPLNRIPSEDSLPLFAYFAPPLIDAPAVTVQIDSAMSVNGSGTPTPLQATVVQLSGVQQEISANGLSVSISAQATLQADSTVSGSLWVAAVAYDGQGKVVGIRRYQSDNQLSGGESVSFSLNVYSIGGKIDKVELFGEVNS